MDKCHYCNSTNVIRARNDAGFFKTDGIKPTRVYQYLCKDCGYVAHYAKGDK